MGRDLAMNPAGQRGALRGADIFPVSSSGAESAERKKRGKVAQEKAAAPKEEAEIADQEPAPILQGKAVRETAQDGCGGGSGEVLEQVQQEVRRGEGGEEEEEQNQENVEEEAEGVQGRESIL